MLSFPLAPLLYFAGAHLHRPAVDHYRNSPYFDCFSGLKQATLTLGTHWSARLRGTTPIECLRSELPSLDVPGADARLRKSPGKTAWPPPLIAAFPETEVASATAAASTILNHSPPRSLQAPAPQTRNRHLLPSPFSKNSAKLESHVHDAPLEKSHFP